MGFARPTGSIPFDLMDIRDRLGIRADTWLTVIGGYDRLFGQIVGAPSQLIRRAWQAGRHWYWRHGLHRNLRLTSEGRATSLKRVVGGDFWHFWSR
jgi:hypothetical protein